MSVWLALALVLIVAGGFAILRRLHLLSLAISFWVVFATGIAVLIGTDHVMTARWHLGPISGAEAVADPRVLPRDPRVPVLHDHGSEDRARVAAGPAGVRCGGRPGGLAPHRPPDHRVRHEGGGPGGARPGLRRPTPDRAGAVERTLATCGGPHSPADPLGRAGRPGGGHDGHPARRDRPRVRRRARGRPDRGRRRRAHGFGRRAAGDRDPAVARGCHAAGARQRRGDRAGDAGVARPSRRRGRPCRGDPRARGGAVPPVAVATLFGSRPLRFERTFELSYQDGAFTGHRRTRRFDLGAAQRPADHADRPSRVRGAPAARCGR